MYPDFLTIRYTIRERVGKTGASGKTGKILNNTGITFYRPLVLAHDLGKQQNTLSFRIFPVL